MAHLLVEQLRFTRAEFVRGLECVTDEEARRRFTPMNCISWIIGHLAAQEHYLWVQRGLGENINPELYELVGYGKPASTPPLDEMWSAWHAITSKADTFLDTVTAERLEVHIVWQGETESENIGTLLLRNIYHYWFHLGEAYAIRQMLDHTDLPTYVGWIPEVTVSGFCT